MSLRLVEDFWKSDIINNVDFSLVKVFDFSITSFLFLSICIDFISWIYSIDFSLFFVKFSLLENEFVKIQNFALFFEFSIISIDFCLNISSFLPSSVISSVLNELSIYSIIFSLFTLIFDEIYGCEKAIIIDDIAKTLQINKIILYNFFLFFFEVKIWYKNLTSEK